MPHPAVDHILKYFNSQLLPPHRDDVVESFADLAHQVPRTAARRKLLEAKDAAVRDVASAA